MKQSHGHSALESITNTIAGVAVAVCMQRLIFPLYDIYVPVADNISIAGFFTIASVARNYTIRRIFNR